MAITPMPAMLKDRMWAKPGVTIRHAGSMGVIVKAEGVDANMDTFYAARKLIVKLKPRIAVLENVAGILMRRGRNAPDPTIQFVEENEEYGLAKIAGYSYARTMLCASDGGLPTTRQRVWFILVADDVGRAENVTYTIDKLVATFRELPIVHASCFYHDEDEVWDTHPFTACVLPCDQVSITARLGPYAKHLGECFKNAVAAKLLPPSWQLAAPGERTSAKLDINVQMPPFLRASMDVWGEVARYSGEYTIADISQTIGRARPRLKGMVPTLTTSSRLMAFDAGEARWFRPHELMGLHGFEPSSINMAALSWNEGVELAGDGMAMTSVTFVMIAVLKELGFLAHLPEDDDIHPARAPVA